MSKVNLIGSKTLFIKFVIKVIILSIADILLFSSIFSFILLKLDLNIELSKYLSIFIIALSSIIVSYFSVYSFSNNGAVLGIISVLPLIIYSLINCLVFNNDWLIFAVKLAAAVILGAFFGNYSIKKRKKFRVK